MRRHYVVEPHVDDAYLSLHQHITDWIRWGEEVTIASIFSGTRDRAQEAIAYATAVGARWVGYGFDERISKSAPFRQPFHFRSPAGRGREEHLVYTPAGIEHPVHLEVHKWISADFHYLDIPYAYKDRNRHFYNQLISRRVSRKRADMSKGGYWQCFPDQMGFFGRNPPCTYLDKFEVILLPR